MTKNWRWFISKTLRDAVELHKQVIKLLSAQSDLLKQSRVEELQNGLDALKAKLTGPVDKTKLLEEMDAMMIVADRVLLPYPDPKARDWVEMFLVVVVLVLAFRTFFFQPFKIPTGSMQPTLYGITIENLKDHTGTGKVEQGTLTATAPTFQPQDLGRTITFANGDQATITQFLDKQHVKLTPSTDEGEQKFTVNVSFRLPGNTGKAADKLRGYSYHSMQAEGNWRLIRINPPKTIFPLISKQTLFFKDMDSDDNIEIEKSVWFPPLDSHQNPVLGSKPGPEGQPSLYNEYSKGDFIYKMRVKTGDHLFVNRITFNFRRPRRGDICVFSTKGVPVTGDVNAAEIFYIKRLVALGNETISIGNDRHIRINGRRIDANDSGFEFLYDFPIGFKPINGHVAWIPRNPAIDSVYSGHVNNTQGGAHRNLAPFFQKSESTLKLKPNQYLMFGDNTTNSSDSRTWGQLPMRNVIGKSSFVYWPPLSPRFGWSHR
jgi:signal peptidase I